MCTTQFEIVFTGSSLQRLFVGSNDGAEASLLHELFNSDLTRRFLKSIVFADSKRPVTADILNRIDVKKIAEQLGKEERLSDYLQQGTVKSNGQGLLVFEPTCKLRSSAP